MKSIIQEIDVGLLIAVDLLEIVIERVLEAGRHEVGLLEAGKPISVERPLKELDRQ